jgi:hypothetical protein
MANCNEQQCKQLLKKLSRSNARVRRRKERLNIALVVLGLSTPAPLTVIGVHLANIAAANAATVAFPGIGWAFGGITAALIVTAYVLYRQTVIERNKRDALCQQAHDVCDLECLPGYCR